MERFGAKQQGSFMC